MPITNRTLLDALERSLRFVITGADVTRIGTGHTTGWRTLPGCTTAHLQEITIQLELRGEQTLVLRPGEAFILDAGVHHRSSVSAGTGCSRWSLFDCRIFGSVPLMSLITLPVVLRGAAARRLGDINAALGAAFNTRDPGLPATLRQHARAADLVSFLVDAGSLRAHAHLLLAHAQRLSSVLDHIEAHAASPVSRSGLARISGLSPSRFHALFTTAMGMSPVAYALSRRLQLASHLLIASELPVQEVASRLGFADPFYFSRLFKSRMRVSPNSYRKQARLGLTAVKPA
jgi:AraC-like DNA-binding protein